MIHEACRPVYKWSRFFLRTDGTGRDGPTEGSTRGPRGPKNEREPTWLFSFVAAQNSGVALCRASNTFTPTCSFIFIQPTPTSAFYNLIVCKQGRLAPIYIWYLYKESILISIWNTRNCPVYLSSWTSFAFLLFFLGQCQSDVTSKGPQTDRQTPLVHDN